MEGRGDVDGELQLPCDIISDREASSHVRKRHFSYRTQH